MSGSHCCLITLAQTLTTDPFGQALLLTAPEKSDHCVWACSFLPQYTMVCSIPTLHAGKKLKQRKKQQQQKTKKTYRPRMKTNEKLNRTQRVHRSSRTGVLFPAVLILIFWISSTEPLGETGLEVLRRMSLAVGGWGCGFEVLIIPAGWHTVCLSYIMIQALMAAGNVWSQMKSSIEFNFWVSLQAQGSPGSMAHGCFIPALQLRAPKQGEQRGDSVARK